MKREYMVINQINIQNKLFTSKKKAEAFLEEMVPWGGKWKIIPLVDGVPSIKHDYTRPVSSYIRPSGTPKVVIYQNRGALKIREGR